MPVFIVLVFLIHNFIWQWQILIKILEWIQSVFICFLSGSWISCLDSDQVEELQTLKEMLVEKRQCQRLIDCLCKWFFFLLSAAINICQSAMWHPGGAQHETPQRSPQFLSVGHDSESRFFSCLEADGGKSFFQFNSPAKERGTHFIKKYWDQVLTLLS